MQKKEKDKKEQKKEELGYYAVVWQKK